jgi:GNAT superfamily N-acetyltransferase
MHPQIVEIDAEAALPLRQQVLWPDHSADFSRVPGDESAIHLGAFIDRELVSVLSLFTENNTMRLRKFATDPNWQNCGIGGAMITEALDLAQKSGITRLWLSARETAVPFYKRFGLKPYGEREIKEGEPYRKMQVTLTSGQSLASSA